MIELRRTGTLLVTVLLLAACGGGSTASTSTERSAPPSQVAPSEGGPTDATPTDAAPTDAATVDPGGGGDVSGGGGDAACELVSADEIGGVLGQSGIAVTMDSPGDVSYCIYGDASGEAVVATSVMSRGGAAAFSIWKTGAGVQDVDGLGDDAVFDPSTASLLVLKGDAVLSLTAGDGTEPEEQRLEWSKAIAEIAIERL